MDEIATEHAGEDGALVDRVNAAREYATAFVERGGRVWLFGVGPRSPEVASAIIVVDGKRMTKAQGEIVETVSAVLSAAYTSAAPTEPEPDADAGDGESAPDPEQDA